MNNKKKKIGFVIGSLSSGGAERVISTISNELIKDFDITIITFSKSDPFYKLNENIKVISCFKKIPKPSSVFGSLKLNFLLIKRVKDISSKEQVDILIGFITSANVITVIASKLNQIPCIISERNNPLVEDVPKFWVLLRNYFYPKADKIILQTKGVKKIYEKKIKSEKIKILPNPISSELSKSRIDALKKEKVILTVGRLDKNKCQDELISAFNIIKPNGWKLKIIGDGNKKQELSKLIENFNLGDSVEIISKVKNIEKYYNEASIFVFTSKTEGFPNALLEAMHFGLPCISTDCNFGPSDLIKNGENGFLIPVNNQEELVEKLLKLIEDVPLRRIFSEKAKETTKKYKSNIVVREWESLISSFIS